MKRDQALAIVDDLYEAAFGTVPWAHALAAFADGMRHVATSLELHDVVSGRLLDFQCARIDPAFATSYARDYADNPRVAFLRNSRSPIAYDQLFITEGEMDRDPYYADFLASQGFRYFMSAHTPLIDGRVRGLISVQRSGKVRGIDREQVRLLQHFQPHIARALALYLNRVGAAVDPDGFDRLLASYRLTPAEQRLAMALALGESLPGYAQRTRRSMNTVYTHYRTLKAKLDCATQAELLAQLQALQRYNCFKATWAAGRAQ